MSGIISKVSAKVVSVLAAAGVAVTTFGHFADHTVTAVVATALSVITAVSAYVGKA